jgi:transposase
VSVGLVENATCAILAAMTKLELLEQELATLQAEETRQRLLLEEKAMLLEQKIAVLKQQASLIEQKDALLSEQSATIRKQEEKLAAQQLEINRLIQQAFGRRSERYLESPQQLKIDFGGGPEVTDAAEGLQQAVDEKQLADEAVATSAEVPSARPAAPQKKKKKRDESLPANLPRIEKMIDVPESDKTCATHGEKTLIGYDVRESLVYIPPQLEIRVTKFPKYACPNQPECKVTQAERPKGLVEGDRYDTSVAAEIITANLGYHLPLYREQDVFAGSGWAPHRSTLLNIKTAAAELVEPLVRFFADEVRKDAVIGTDDTGVTLLLPKVLPEIIPNDVRSQRIHEVFSTAFKEDKKHVKAKMWAYRGSTVPLNIFDFTVSRHRDGPDQFLIDNQFKGVLIADCYSGYTGISLRSNDGITHAACNAHARRKIFEARDNHPQVASVLLAMFQELYDIETRAIGLDALSRLNLRQQESAAVWLRMREYLDGEIVKKLLPKDAMSQAIGYINNHWAALQVYVSNAAVPIDNNDTEQLMKQVAIGRKNWLFIGSLAAGTRTADLMTLVSSAVRNDLHVWAYLKGVLDALLAGCTDYHSLRPDVWATAHPEQIRTYRKDERRDRADRKQLAREERRNARG